MNVFERLEQRATELAERNRRGGFAPYEGYWREHLLRRVGTACAACGEQLTTVEQSIEHPHV